MPEQIEITEELAGEDGPRPMLELARKVLLAGFGAVALAQDEIEDFVKRLVERGEIAEKDGRKLVKDMLERRGQRTGKLRKEAAFEFDKRVDAILKRMNIPSRSDIEELNRKVTALSRKVDQLKKSQSEK